MFRKYFQTQSNNSVVQSLCCRKPCFDLGLAVFSKDSYSRKPLLGALKVASVVGRLLGKNVEQRWHQARVPSTGERKQTMAISLSGSVSVIQPYSSSLFLAPAPPPAEMEDSNSSILMQSKKCIIVKYSMTRCQKTL